MQDYEHFYFMKIAPVVIEFVIAMVFTLKSRAISRYLLNGDRSPQDT